MFANKILVFLCFVKISFCEIYGAELAYGDLENSESEPEVASRIFEGNSQSFEKRNNYMVHISVFNSRDQLTFCSGSLISQDKVSKI